MRLCIVTSAAVIMVLRRYLTYKNLVSFNHCSGGKGISELEKYI